MRRFWPILLLLLAGCSLLPEWRVFQKKVPATLTETPKAQIEGQRQAAAFIRAKTTPPVPDPAKAIADIQPVAQALSASLGEPLRAISGDSTAERDQVIASLRNGLKAKEAQLEAWKAFGRKYGGKELEGTGINLAGPTGLLVLAAIVAACIACPVFGYLVLRVVPLLWGYFTRTTSAIAEFTAEHKEAGENLKTKLSQRMDEAHKRLVKLRRIQA